MTSIILPSNSNAANLITSETLPTTRANGSALQTGDRWYKPSLGREGFWSGTYWLGQEKSISYGSFFTSISATGAQNFGVATGVSVKAGQGILLKSVTFLFYVGSSSLTATNYWDITSSGVEWAAASLGNVANVYAFPSPATYRLDSPLRAVALTFPASNLALTTEGAYIYEYKLSCTKVGSPANLTRNGLVYQYQDIYLL